MQKLLVIVGQTATGKTKLALQLANKFSGELISADSRQVYKQLNIGTGKDLHLLNKTKIWGYDLVDPKKNYSVSEYVKYTKKIIDNIHKQNRLPILVGGTGLYIKGVTDGIETINIPENKGLRKSLKNKNAEELFRILLQMDSLRAASMNASDKKNPRRLVRAIEISESKDKVSKNNITKYNLLFIGLTAPQDKIGKRIKKRVLERLEMGIEKEINELLKSGVKWGDQSMSSLGYKQWREFYEGKVSREQVVENWTKAEQKYAKRQLTWFKRDKRIHWFNVSNKNWEKQVENMVKKWHNKKDDA